MLLQIPAPLSECHVWFCTVTDACAGNTWQELAKRTVTWLQPSFDACHLLQAEPYLWAHASSRRSGCAKGRTQLKACTGFSRTTMLLAERRVLSRSVVPHRKATRLVARFGSRGWLPVTFSTGMHARIGARIAGQACTRAHSCWSGARTSLVVSEATQSLSYRRCDDLGALL